MQMPRGRKDPAPMCTPGRLGPGTMAHRTNELQAPMLLVPIIDLRQERLALLLAILRRVSDDVEFCSFAVSAEL